MGSSTRRIIKVRGRRRRSFSKMQAVPMMLVVLATTLAASVGAIEILFRNLCDHEMSLSNGKKINKIQKDSFLIKTLEVGGIEAFRYGASPQATLAEFTVDNTTTWYDIGIIPTGPRSGPEDCTSLEHCKAYTNGTGFNVPMKIVPRLQDDAFYNAECMTVNCFEDGCPDAYHFPNDPFKTRNCPSSVDFAVVFCATPSTGSLDGSLGWTAQVESAELELPAPAPSMTPTPSSEPTTPPQVASTAHGNGSGDGTSVAVIVASIVGGFVALFAAAVLVRRFRYRRLEKMNATRYSSDAMMYVEARDTNAL